MRGLTATLGLLWLAACGAEGPSQPPNLPAFVVIENASQYVLEELRFHQSAQYSAATNVLPAPLTVGSTMSRHLQSSTYLTVFREKFRGGELLALTTASAILLEPATGYRVKVFDGSFRVEPETYVAPTQTGTRTSTTP